MHGSQLSLCHKEPARSKQKDLLVLWHKSVGVATFRNSPRHRGGPHCFRLGVHFDADETTGDNTGDAHGFIENETSTAGSGIGFTGFWLDYWQNTC